MHRYTALPLQRLLLCSTMAAAFAPLTVLADPLDNLPYALSGGTPNVDVRLRYETVEQERPASIVHDAEAATLRTRLGYTTGRWSGLDAQLEFEHLTLAGASDFNSTENVRKPGVGGYPVVADPEGSEVNQAWLRYTGPARSSVKLGRQRIVFDNARFIGNVGWRQREQTYDALLLGTGVIPKTTLQYAWLDKVHAFRAFNYGSAAAPQLSLERDIRGHLVNAAFSPSPLATLVAYGYWLDFGPDTLRTTPPPPAPLDSRTLGLRASGSLSRGDVKFGYALEAAQQDAYGDAPDSVDARYQLAELSAGWAALQLKLGYEVLGSNDGRYGFQTPLATLHAFQGWADVFLTTPPSGIEESYVSLGATVARFALLSRYSVYGAEHGSGDYGEELNLQLTRPFGEQLTVGLKYAAYRGDSAAPAPDTPAFAALRGDVDKTWAWVEYRF